MHPFLYDYVSSLNIKYLYSTVKNVMAMLCRCTSNSFSSHGDTEQTAQQKPLIGREKGWGSWLGWTLSCLDYVTNLFDPRYIGNVSVDESNALPFSLL